MRTLHVAVLLAVVENAHLSGALAGAHMRLRGGKWVNDDKRHQTTRAKCP
jgi:hypothetical protein